MQTLETIYFSTGVTRDIIRPAHIRRQIFLDMGSAAAAEFKKGYTS
jgi:hypothetical protein